MLTALCQKSSRSEEKNLSPASACECMPSVALFCTYTLTCSHFHSHLLLRLLAHTHALPL